MSRLDAARDAVRPALKARMMLSGPAGSGKTRTALICASVLAEDEPVLVIDTERESALTYADDFAFKHLIWEPPYDPRELGREVMAAGESFGVVIVDSASHFWRGDGGTLDIADGKFGGWKTARPAQSDLVAAILQTRAHVIVCSRSKVEYVQEMDGGKHVVRKLGMAVIQDDTLEYELNVAVELAMDHTMTVAKSRSIAVPVGRTFKAGHAEDFANEYADWLKGGEPLASGEDVADLADRMNALGNGRKVACKQEFMALFGRPDHLRESQVSDAQALVTKWENTPPIHAEDEPPAPSGTEDTA